MNTVWKYKLQIGQPIQIAMPMDSKIINVSTQSGSPYLWAIVNSKKETEVRRFVLYGTGHKILENLETLNYIGTFILYSGKLVFHVFEIIN